MHEPLRQRIAVQYHPEGLTREKLDALVLRHRFLRRRFRRRLASTGRAHLFPGEAVALTGWIYRHPREARRR